MSYCASVKGGWFHSCCGQKNQIKKFKRNYMNSNTIICGTSFLLPKNEAWNSLGPSNEITFSEYGDWRGSLTRCKKNQMMIFVIFVTDLLHNSSQANKNSKKKII
jgi:hypothetical protein